MSRLFSYVRRHWRGYAFGMFCTLVTASLANVIPLLSRDAINATQTGHYAEIARAVELMIACALGIIIARFFSRFVTYNTGRDVEYELRRDLLHHLSRLRPDFYQRMQTGDLMSRMINDLNAVRMLLGMGALMCVNVPLYYAYSLTIMVHLNRRLTLAVILPYLIMSFLLRRLTRSIMQRSLRVQQGLGAIGAKVQESLAGIHVVKAYTMEDHEARRFRALNDDYNEQGLALARIRGGMFPMIRSSVAVATMIVLIYGGAQVINHRMTIGDLQAFLSYLGLLAMPTGQMGWVVSIYQRGKASMRRLDEIFEYPAPEEITGDEARLEVTGSIQWDHVSFSYFAGDGASNGHAPYALKDVSVTVPAGQKLAIVGRTGSGKSTMVKLLARLIDPTEGRVLLDGRDIRELPTSALRKTIGLVPQETTLFSDTLARNVAFGRPDASMDEVAASANIAGLAPDISALPHGYDTIVGERGMALSGGQKQRVTIARLLTYNPKVVVLDVALSSVDTETEKAVLTSLEQSVRDRTTIVVSHRASTVRDSDQIIVLEEGEVVERGTHEQLMTRHGIYAELFHRQLVEEELAQY
ncbi:MAG TPA: ABC transporter ATP-binding protein [Candidatus Binataceae bacterium]|nr:ABC transporter ATP-binding protein [Candidatus Binataceae bacterium]